MKNFGTEFKKFITRGNILDLSVAVIIGGAFGKIISSLVKDVLMPIISLVLGDEGFENYKYIISPADEVNGISENAIYYGLFIQNIIDFLIIAFVIFLIIRLISKINNLANQKRLEEELKEKELVIKKNIEQQEKQQSVEQTLQDIKILLENKLK